MNYGTFFVDDVYAIMGRSIVATGKVMNGTFQVGDNVVIMRQDGREIKSTVKRIEVFGHIVYAEKGDNIGMMLAGIAKEDINIGDFIKR